MTATKIQPVAEICSASHDDAQFGERDIKLLRDISGFEYGTPLYAGAAPAAVAPQGEYPHEQMDAMALARYKVVPSHASMLWSHAVVAGHGAQQLYVGREVECQNMARKFAGAFLDGAFAFHSMAAAPTAQAAPALEAPAAPAVPAGFALVPMRLTRAMGEVLEEEGWQWEDLLAAAGAITESDHTAISRGEPSDGEIQESFAAYGAELTDKHLEAVREIVGNALAAAPQAPNCTRCSGSGEDPEGYLTHGRGPDDHTVDGPCRECDGTGAAPLAPAAPVGLPWRTGIPAWTEDRSVRVIAVTALDDFGGVQVHDIRASDFHAEGDGDGAEVARVCTHWAYRDDIWPRADAAAPAAPAVDAQAERDAAFEAVRNRLCGLQRYSFVLDDDGVVRRAQDRTGSWIEFDDAHALFDPVAVDAAIAAQAKEGGA